MPRAASSPVGPNPRPGALRLQKHAGTAGAKLAARPRLPTATVDQVDGATWSTAAVGRTLWTSRGRAAIGRPAHPCPTASPTPRDGYNHPHGDGQRCRAGRGSRVDGRVAWWPPAGGHEARQLLQLCIGARLTKLQSRSKGGLQGVMWDLADVLADHHCCRRRPVHCASEALPVGAPTPQSSDLSAVGSQPNPVTTPRRGCQKSRRKQLCRTRDRWSRVRGA